MAKSTLHKLTPATEPKPQQRQKPAEKARKPLRSVALISRALPINPDMDPDVRHYLKQDLQDLSKATENLKALNLTLDLSEDSFVFAIDTILEAGIERLEAVYHSFQSTVSMLEPAEKGGAR